MEITCWICDVQPLSDPALFSRGMALLPWEERREQIMRFYLERDRRLCLGAGLLLAYALRHPGAADLTLRRLPNGKPVLAANPDIHFNLSHSGILAVCAVSDQPVGVDAEVLQSGDPEAAAFCFQPPELEWMHQFEHSAYPFTRLWTRKESYLKLLGTGLSRSPNSFCAIPGQDTPAGCTFHEHEKDGHLICVCSFQNNDIIFREWGLLSEGIGCAEDVITESLETDEGSLTPNR